LRNARPEKKEAVEVRSIGTGRRAGQCYLKRIILTATCSSTMASLDETRFSRRPWAIRSANGGSTPRRSLPAAAAEQCAFTGPFIGSVETRWRTERRDLEHPEDRAGCSARTVGGVCLSRSYKSTDKVSEHGLVVRLKSQLCILKSLDSRDEIPAFDVRIFAIRSLAG